MQKSEVLPFMAMLNRVRDAMYGRPVCPFPLYLANGRSDLVRHPQLVFQLVVESSIRTPNWGDQR